MSSLPRRTFLATAAAAAAAPAPPAPKGPNDRIRVAIVGLRGRGRDLIQGFHAMASANVEIAAFCDVDQSVLDARTADYEKLSGRKLTTARDFRRVLDDPSIDAVALATPNHWHALGTVWACQAGKDVYCEKPGTHSYWEGPRVIEAAKKYQRIVAHGTQNRSSPNIVDAVAKLKEGVIGRVHTARGVAYKYRASVGGVKPAPVPAGLDWDQWLGPAPMTQYSRRIHGSSGNGWHLLWDYGCGEIGNQGVHELDIIRWALGLKDHPSKVVSMGGAYVHQDRQPTPQVQAMMFEWAGRDVLVTFETRGGWTNTEAGMGAEYPFLDKKNVVGVIFIGTSGYMIVPDYSSYHVFRENGRRPEISKAGSGGIETEPHVANFIKAMRSRRPEDLTAGTADLHYSSSLAHFANISQRVGRMLHFDPQSESFRGDAEATALLKRTYRAPYVLPEKV